MLIIQAIPKDLNLHHKINIYREPQNIFVIFKGNIAALYILSHVTGENCSSSKKFHAWREKL